MRRSAYRRTPGLRPIPAVLCATPLGRPSALSDVSGREQGTRSLDPLLSVKIDPMNGREARESALRLRAVQKARIRPRLGSYIRPQRMGFWSAVRPEPDVLRIQSAGRRSCRRELSSTYQTQPAQYQHAFDVGAADPRKLAGHDAVANARRVLTLRKDLLEGLYDNNDPAVARL